jgi:hypothetical protein
MSDIKPDDYSTDEEIQKGEQLRVCEHIIVSGHKGTIGDWGCYELIGNLNIYCEQCQKWYKYVMGVK